MNTVGEDEEEGKSSSLQNRIMANNKKKVLKRLKRCICTVILWALLTATARFRGPGFELQPLCLRSSLLLTCTLEAAGAGSRSDFPVPQRQLQPWLLQEFEKPSRGKASVLKIVHNSMVVLKICVMHAFKDLHMCFPLWVRACVFFSLTRKFPPIAFYTETMRMVAAFCLFCPAGGFVMK